MTGDQASSASLSAAAAREAALREILAVLRDSRDDETPVFDAILRNAQTLCDAPMAGLVLGTAEDAVQSLAAHIGVQPQTIEMFESGRMLMDGGISHSARSILEARTVVFDDMGASDLYVAGSPVVRAMVDESGIRSVLFAPLVQDGAAIGTITLFRHDVDPFDADEIALVESFAAHAVIAIENVRQFRELQARLEREGATREVLEVIARSRDDEGPVFDAILESAARLCHAPGANLLMLDETRENVFLAATQGAERQAHLGESHPLDTDHTPSVAIRSRAPFQIADLADTDAYRNGDPIRRQLVDEAGLRSSLAVPLLRGEGAVGAIVLMRGEDQGPFSDADVALLETFAAQAVIAIENVRQFRELQTRLERETATREILHVISQTRDDERPVFEEVLRSARRLCGAESAALLLGRADGGTLTLAALDDVDAAHAANREAIIAEVNATPLPLDPELHLAARAILTGETLQIEDLADTHAYRVGEPTRRIMVDEQGLRTALTVPLFVRDEAVGAVNLHRRERRPFSPEDVALVQTFAAQAAIAIENARQFRELQTRLEREAATREILEVISTSRDDEKPVFDAILEAASRLCRAPLAFLTLADEARENVVVPAYRGTTPEFSAILDVFAEPIDRSELIAVRPVATGEVMRIGDMKDTDLYRSGDPRRLQMVDVEGVRSVVGVPLLRGGVGIGCLVLYRREVAPFSDDDVALVQAFAAQAVIAIENVRQFRELQTRLEREAATRRILEVISSSRDDEAPVFDAILEAACRLCDAPLAYLVMADGGGGGDDRRVRCPARRGAFVTFGETLDQLSVTVDSRLALVRSFVEGRVIRIDDIADDDLYRAGDPNRVSMVEDEGARSILVAPLMRGGTGLGSITLYRREVAPFSDDDVALVQAFAAQAVIAIENVRQFRELQTRLEREAATREILEVISRSRDDEAPVFDAILRNAQRLCGAPFGNLSMVSPDGARLEIKSDGIAPFDPFRPGWSWPIESGLLVARSVRETAVLQLQDAAEDPIFAQGDPDRVTVVEAGVRTVLTVPLLSDGAAIGSMALFRRERKPFSADEIALVETFAAQAVIAIDNVRQFKALEALNAELGERVEEQVGELERMARLKRFLSPQVAQAITSTGSEAKLSSHRALVAVLFADIRGFTAFCETAEPEETIEVLQTYHEEMGRLLHEHGAGVDHRSGDGIMAIFNDPLPCDDPAGDAVRLAVAMRARMAELCARWRKLGHRLGFGVGVSLGYATVGMVGSEGRYDYTASGTAVNLGARLCDQAADGEILLSPRAALAVEDAFPAEPVGEMDFKGIREPVEVFRLLAPAEG